MATLLRAELGSIFSVPHCPYVGLIPATFYLASNEAWKNLVVYYIIVGLN